MRALGGSGETYDLGDISVHMTSVYHCAAPNLTTATRMIVGSTYFEDGATMRTDLSSPGPQLGEGASGDAATATAVAAKLTRRQRDFARFAPGVVAGSPIASEFNPILGRPIVGSSSQLSASN
jgi:hypothetical protein